VPVAQLDGHWALLGGAGRVEGLQTAWMYTLQCRRTQRDITYSEMYDLKLLATCTTLCGFVVKVNIIKTLNNQKTLQLIESADWESL
jgi:hypothetical protein